MKVAIIYGSTTGTTESAAELIAEKLPYDVTVTNVSKANPELVSAADLVLLGSSTWGYGELQDDFLDYMDQINADNYKDKKVAVFGCGDAISFTDVFCEAVTIISEKLDQAGADLAFEPLKIDGSVDNNLDAIDQFLQQF